MSSFFSSIQNFSANQALLTTPKPTCLDAASLESAQSLCAAKQVSGTAQQAVAGLGWFRGFGSTDYSAAINADPCSWAALPPCTPVIPPPKPSMSKTPPPPKPSMRASSSIMTQTPEPPPATVSVIPPTQAPVAPPPPKHDTTLIVGGVLLAALAVGGAIYLVEKH